MSKNQWLPVLSKLILMAFFSIANIATAIDIQPRIIGGKDAVIDDFPWQVALVLSSSNLYGTQSCGGSILHKRWIVTAAHCFDITDTNPVPPQFVVIGLSNLTDTSADTHQIIAIKSTIKHPEYNKTTLDNDIALVQLSADIDFSVCEAANNCATIEVATPETEANLIPLGTPVWISGWGNISKKSTIYPTQLQSAQVNMVDCLDVDGNYTSSDVTDNMICAQTLGFDTCVGDSGGPLAADSNDGTGSVLAGITSWGPLECDTAGEPGVYTRIANYSCWLNETSDGELNIPVTSCASGSDTSSNMPTQKGGSSGSIAWLSLVFLALFLRLTRQTTLRQSL
ncbi:MAG: serine protease [Pseudomonadales bacterium]|nr:serine protease [Pseudomonadales bacterium]